MKPRKTLKNTPRSSTGTPTSATTRTRTLQAVKGRYSRGVWYVGLAFGDDPVQEVVYEVAYGSAGRILKWREMECHGGDATWHWAVTGAWAEAKGIPLQATEVRPSPYAVRMVLEAIGAAEGEVLRAHRYAQQKVARAERRLSKVMQEAVALGVPEPSVSDIRTRARQIVEKMFGP